MLKMCLTTPLIFIHHFKGDEGMGQILIHAKDIQPQEKAVWIDARYDLADSAYGRTRYDVEHIVGAVHWDLSKDLSDTTQEKSGRHPMPTKAQLHDLFERTGITYETPIYIYDGGGEPFATRAYWLLQYGGFTNARVVADGIEGLKQAGFEMTTVQPNLERTTIDIDWQDQIYVNREYVKEVTEGKHNKVLIDARAHRRYIGEVEPLDPIAGHIPTARNFDWEQLKKENELFINKAIEQVASKDEKIIVYCGSGVSASPLYVALKELGYEHVQLYTGSYSDWVVHYPVATGEE